MLHSLKAILRDPICSALMGSGNDFWLDFQRQGFKTHKCFNSTEYSCDSRASIGTKPCIERIIIDSMDFQSKYDKVANAHNDSMLWHSSNEIAMQHYQYL